jgi:hypothetical protein
MYAYVVTARQRMSGVDRFDLPGIRLTTNTPDIPALGRQGTLQDFPGARGAPSTSRHRIDFIYFLDFTESMYPGLRLRLYPRSSKIVSANWRASEDCARAASIEGVISAAFYSSLQDPRH